MNETSIFVRDGDQTQEVQAAVYEMARQGGIVHLMGSFKLGSLHVPANVELRNDGSRQEFTGLRLGDA